MRLDPYQFIQREWRLLLRRGGLYLLVGLSAFAVDYTVFIVLAQGQAMHVATANLIATCVSMLVSFGGNSLFTFQLHTKLLRRFIKFSFVNVIGYGLSTAVILGMMHWQDSLHVAKLCGVMVAVAVMFTIHYFWTFHGHRH